MTDSTLTFETTRGAPMQENAVVETVNVGAFPTAFSTNPAVNNAQNTVMVVVDTTIITSRSGVIKELEEIMKSVMQSTNLA